MPCGVILKILVQIMNGMSACATELQKYLTYWDKYRPLWEMDKDAFIRRYAKAQRPLSQYDIDITRYKDQQSDIALAAFSEAARLNPSDPLIAQSLAQAALEAGRPASGRRPPGGLAGRLRPGGQPALACCMSHVHVACCMCVSHVHVTCACCMAARSATDRWSALAVLF